MATRKVASAGGLDKAAVRALMDKKLADSCITPADAKTLKMEPITAHECKELNLPATAAGFRIPYFDMHGKPTKFFRFRYLEDTRKGFAKFSKRKALRYSQPSLTNAEVYLPPLVKWDAIAQDKDTSLLITEGELKAACGCLMGLPTLGLGGVWSFMSKKNVEALIPAFDAFEWNERPVFICYDSDGATNPDVVKAESRLAYQLSQRGAVVFICRLQSSEPDEEGNVEKVALDDYILKYGSEQFEAEVMRKAYAYQECVELHRLNSEVLYVRDPGFIWDHKSSMKLSPGAFKEHAYSNRHFTQEILLASGATKLVQKPAAPAWLEWPARSEVSGIDYAPGQGRITDDDKLNMWEGWGVPEPSEGDVDEWHRLMDHIFAQDADARTYFERWAAYPLQRPGTKMHVAAAIWGPVHGSGKTLIGETLSRIYGANASELKDADLDNVRFDWAENKQFALADDISSRGDRKFMRKLMTMVTQRTVRVDPKYVPAYSVTDRINYIFTSNDPDALFMDDQDRRFFVHEVRAGKFDWYSYVEWKNSYSGIAALWHYLLNLDLGDFNPHAPAPETVGKSQMIELGKSELGSWVHEFKTNTKNVLERAKYKGDLFTAQELHFLFDPHGDKKASVNALARELKRAGFAPPATGNKLRLKDGTQLTTYAVLNQSFWATASWREACDHYDVTHPAMPGPKSKKF